jgi:hypothetical protein
MCYCVVGGTNSNSVVEFCIQMFNQHIYLDFLVHFQTVIPRIITCAFHGSTHRTAHRSPCQHPHIVQPSFTSGTTHDVKESNVALPTRRTAIVHQRHHTTSRPHTTPRCPHYIMLSSTLTSL